MRWTLVDGKLATEDGERVEESQTVEFKTSLAERDDAIQSMVAFANSQGGKVFFGVKDDGSVVGVDMGKNTSENLSTAIRDHTYLSLPVDSIEEIDYDGKKVVLVECPSDVPPVVGVYLYSSSPIPLDKPVDAQVLQAYRRVGKSTLKEDFMRMRPAMPSDPKLRVALAGGTQSVSTSPFQCVVWAEEESATAHRITFRLDPSVGACKKTIPDLPLPFRPLNQRDFYNHHTIGFAHEQHDLAQLKDLQVIVSFWDDWGLEWQSTRRLCISSNELKDGGGFRRRIVGFPPKVNRGVKS